MTHKKLAREEKYIMRILERGDSIRRIDGRYKDSFVDQETLEALIEEERAEVYPLQGLDFVRIAKAEKR